MCGIFGFVGRGSSLANIKTLLMVNDQRGGDSTGLYTYREGREPNEALVFKTLGRGVAFLKSIADPSSFIENSNVVIGHVRAATVGAKTVDNAHPFEVQKPNGHYINGAHNGTLTNHFSISSAEAFTPAPTVDSKVLFMLIAKHGPRELPRLFGHMAIAYYDTESNTVSLYRRKERPLFVGQSEQGLYFSSMEEGLIAIGATDIRQLPENVMFVFDASTGNEVSNFEIEDKTIPVTYGSTTTYHKPATTDYGRTNAYGDNWYGRQGLLPSTHTPPASLSKYFYQIAIPAYAPSKSEPQAPELVSAVADTLFDIIIDIDDFFYALEAYKADLESGISKGVEDVPNVYDFVSMPNWSRAILCLQMVTDMRKAVEYKLRTVYSNNKYIPEHIQRYAPITPERLYLTKYNPDKLASSQKVLEAAFASKMEDAIAEYDDATSSLVMAIEEIEDSDPWKTVSSLANYSRGRKKEKQRSDSSQSPTLPLEPEENLVVSTED